jgi:predicted nicotinamide N-methyase
MEQKAYHGTPAARRLAELSARLRAKFRTVDVPLTLPWSGTHCSILQPATFDRLLTAAARDPEQNLPYWATIWPSGVALADAILGQPELVRNKQVLELGCGLGTTAVGALAAGADLLVTDYSSESLLLCRMNTLLNVGVEPQTLQLNWRDPSPVLLAQAPFPVVLAADVLYEGRDVEPLWALLARILLPGGTLWLAEPGRPPAQRFVQVAKLAGWHEDLIEHPGPWPDPDDEGVVVRLHKLTKPMMDDDNDDDFTVSFVAVSNLSSADVQ